MSSLIIKSTMILVAVTMVGRLLGFIRNIFIANEFGMGIESDAFFMAFTIPFTLFLIVPGAINAVLIPTLKGLLGQEFEARRNELFQKTLTGVTIVFTALTIIGTIWAEWIISLLAYGFSPEKQTLTAELLRIMMPSTLFIGIISVFSSVLHAHHEFLAPSLGTVINSLLVIVSLYTLVPFLGVHGMAWGTTIGFAVFASYLIKPVRNRKYSMKWNAAFRKDSLLYGMGERFVPVMVGMFVSQLYLFLERFLVSGLGDQKLTSLVFANSIVQLPIAIFAGALAVPLFPLLSEYVKKQQIDEMKGIMGKGLLYQYHVLLPSTLGLILLAEEFVRLFYSHGENFTAQDVNLTAKAMMFYSLGMLGWAGRDMLTRAFYALDNTKTPVVVGAVSLGVYVILGLLLIPLFDHGGIAFAFSLSSFFNVFVQAWLLRKQIGRLFPGDFYLSLGKGFLAGLTMAAGIWLLRDLTMGLWLFQVPFLVIAAAVLYFVTLILLKENAVKELAAQLLSRFTLSRSR